MKNRRNIIIAFLLCACLFVGIGYAAIADQLTVNGTVKYDATPATELDANIYFNGDVTIVDANHIEKTTDAVILDVTSGDQNAIITATFNSLNLAPFHSGTQYAMGFIFGITIDNHLGSEALTLNLTAPVISGEVATDSVYTDSPFSLESTIKDSTDTNEINTITVEAGKMTTIYLHVRLTMRETVVTNGADIPVKSFKVVLPVTA